MTPFSKRPRSGVGPRARLLRARAKSGPGWYALWPFKQALYVLGTIVISASWFAYYVWYWETYENFNRSIEFCELPYCDFVLFYYEQAKVILESHGPIYKYFYSPTFALFLLPLARMPLQEAIDAWTLVQAGSLLLFVVAGVGMLRKEPWWSHAAFLMLTLTSYPIIHNWKWGQANTTFIALTMSSLALGDRVPASLRALPLALATSARYYPALYVLGFVQRRDWRSIMWFGLLSVLLLAALPALLMGPDRALDFYVASGKATSEATKSWVLGYRGSQYMASVLGRHGGALSLDAPSVLPYVMAVGYALAMLNVVVALRGTGTTREVRTSWAFSFFALCTPLLLPTSWVHYFVYLPLVHAFVLAQTLRVGLPLLARCALLLVLWVPSVVLTTIFFHNAQSMFVDYSVRGYPFYANSLLLVLAHVVALRSRGGSTVVLASGSAAQVVPS